MKRLLLAGLAICAVAGSSQTQAHHSVNGVYNVEKSAMISGVITEVEWVNPHIHFDMMVRDEKTKKDALWRFECVPVGVARRAGLSKESLMSGGKPVQVRFNPSRNGDLTGYANELMMADGRRILFNGSRQ